jgi:ribosomal protein S18 acetylase RimI-like enzyme
VVMVLYEILPASRLDEIKHLWEALNLVHFDDSVYFREHFASFTFEKRSAHWRAMSEKNILILVAKADDQKLIGYCVSTIDDANEGEIDSIFVEPEYRGKQIGRELVLKSLDWLRKNNCKPIRLAVSYGHESVIGFYQKLGFYPRLSVLEWKAMK